MRCVHSVVRRRLRDLLRHPRLLQPRLQLLRLLQPLLRQHLLPRLYYLLRNPSHGLRHHR